VGIAVEPHDDFVRSASVAPIFERVPQPAVGAVWDVGNTFAAGEDPAEGFQWLGQRLFYVQVKDSIGRYPDRRLTRLGEGEVPLAGAVELLLNHGYCGALSVEWERAWHSDLDPAEVALPHALKVMRDLLAASALEVSP
jgi:sugar phosphate isomerase/epimerase